MKQLAAMIIADWTFKDLPEGEWTKKHFLNVLHYKVDNLKNNQNGDGAERPIASGVRGWANRYRR